MAPIEPWVPAPPPGLSARARAAYRKGRLLLAGRAPLWAGLVPPGALLLDHRAPGPLTAAGPLPTALCACAFLLLARALAYFGRAPGDAVVPGLGAAMLATYLPLLVRLVGHACASEACLDLCLPACVAGGLLAGLLLAFRARSQQTPPERAQTLLAGCALVLLAAPLGCAVFGLAGLAAVAAGLAVGAAPALVAQPA
jgi:hypothetical protein